VWVDDGPVREIASDAVARATVDDRSARRRRVPRELAPEVGEDLERSVPSTRQVRYKERLASAAEALDRGRFDDARRMVQPVLRDVPDLAFGHELAGLATYRLGQWRAAAAHLERARELDGSVNHHAVLADCYRAMRRYAEVEALWRELCESSPGHALMAEGRIVMAGALADQRLMGAAIDLMARVPAKPKKVREHHLRQWYVLADLYDRTGDVLRARRLFERVAANDPTFVDVDERLRALVR
jgi:tetratricopeptide (TPR) repeat protein